MTTSFEEKTKLELTKPSGSRSDLALERLSKAIQGSSLDEEHQKVAIQILEEVSKGPGRLSKEDLEKDREFWDGIKEEFEKIKEDFPGERWTWCTPIGFLVMPVDALRTQLDGSFTYPTIPHNLVPKVVDWNGRIDPTLRLVDDLGIADAYTARRASLWDIHCHPHNSSQNGEGDRPILTPGHEVFGTDPPTLPLRLHALIDKIENYKRLNLPGSINLVFGSSHLPRIARDPTRQLISFSIEYPIPPCPLDESHHGYPEDATRGIEMQLELPSRLRIKFYHPAYWYYAFERRGDEQHKIGLGEGGLIDDVLALGGMEIQEGGRALRVLARMTEPKKEEGVALWLARLLAWWRG